jgi:hypothetical protein
MKLLIRLIEWIGNLRLTFSRKGSQAAKKQDDYNDPADDNIYPLW